MNVVRQKMRYMGDQLKSVGDLIRWPLQYLRALPWPGRRNNTDNRYPAATEAPADIETPSAYSRDMLAEELRWQERYPRIERALKIAAFALAVFLALPYLLIIIYRFVDPPISALMLRHTVLGYEVKHQWVDFKQISPHLARAAIIAEDSRFCQHWGVDWFAVGEAIEDLEEGAKPRGASTIPMQTAKNLFLWPEQSFVRKVLEVPLAYFMSLVWPKRRVIEVYLNIAEWGPGIYGAEAAARFHFRRSAARLGAEQATLLVAALPNPAVRRAGKAGPATRRKARRIRARVSRERHDAACIFAGN